ncbi:MAG: preprotein translocase subunit SecG [Candidatus Buchananbacteria bacterium]
MYLSIALIIISVLLILAILLQNRGSGLGSAFGGEGNVYRTKRGAEKILFISTIVLVAIYLSLALANFLYPKL